MELRICSDIVDRILIITTYKILIRIMAIEKVVEIDNVTFLPRVLFIC